MPDRGQLGVDSQWKAEQHGECEDADSSLSHRQPRDKQAQHSSRAVRRSDVEPVVVTAGQPPQVDAQPDGTFSEQRRNDVPGDERDHHPCRPEPLLGDGKYQHDQWTEKQRRQVRQPEGTCHKHERWITHEVCDIGARTQEQAVARRRADSVLGDCRCDEYDEVARRDRQRPHSAHHRNRRKTGQ